MTPLGAPSTGQSLHKFKRLLKCLSEGRKQDINMSEAAYGPKSDELISLLDAIVSQWELCEEIDRARVPSFKSEADGYFFAADLLVLVGTQMDAHAEIEAFAEEIESKVTRVKRRSNGSPTSNAVVNALDWYAVGSLIDLTQEEKAYLLLTQPLQDFIAISKRTEHGTPLRELSLSMLNSVGGDEAVDAAARALNGSGGGL